MLAYVHTFTDKSMHRGKHACTHTHIRAQHPRKRAAHAHAYIKHAQMHAHATHTYTHTHVRTYACTHHTRNKHARIHTHTRARKHFQRCIQTVKTYVIEAGYPLTWGIWLWTLGKTLPQASSTHTGFLTKPIADSIAIPSLSNANCVVGRNDSWR